MRFPSRLLTLAFALLPLPVLAIGTEFTYQGTLETGGGPANGPYDLQFQLLDASNAAVGAPIVAENVNVVAGVFSVQLDFGAAAFDGDDRRLRIGVRPGPSTGAFTPLDPPTALTPAPYAQVASVAEIASSIANNTVNSSRVVDGSLGAVDVKSTEIQLRVTGTCLPGSSIRSIDPTGAVTCQPDTGGGGGPFTLPFASTQPDAGPLFSLTNSGNGPGLQGRNASTTSNVAGVHGAITSTSPGGFSTGVRGENAGTGGPGIGVWGSHAGSGWGVYGVTPGGLGVYGNASAAGTGVYASSNTGTGLIATSTNGNPASFTVNNSNNPSNVVEVSTLGNGAGVNVTAGASGAGVRATTNSGFAVHGITSAQTSAGIIGDNNGGGEAVVGRTTSNIAGAVVGRNDGGGYGVRGFVAGNTSNTAVGVFGQVGLNGGTGMAGRFENLNQSNGANTFQVTSNGNGNIPDNTLGNVASFTSTSTNSVAAAVRGEVKTIFANFGAAGIFGVSSGTGGYGGLFHASNINGNGPALIAITDGNGNAFTANAGKNGNAVEANVDGTGTAIYGWVPNFGTGKAGRFANFNTANSQPVLQVSSTGSNALAVFQSGSPAANRIRFDSTGRGYFNGGTQVGGADLAEVVPLTGVTPEPGDVVEIDPDAPSHFRLAATPRSALVAGVISTAPGVTLNHSAADEADDIDAPALALAGRVPVKVTDENGAVAPGDLLVASSTPGHAMRASPDPAAGTVVGKALEAFDDSSAAVDAGVIEMLVMLR